MKKNLICQWLCLTVLAMGANTFALTPAEVQTAIDKGTQFTFVDVRPLTVYKTGHIPNAINVPSQFVAQKQLPPLGAVIVYDDGAGENVAAAAAEAFNKKAGISAQVLDGGFAAWQNIHGSTTHSPGVLREDPQYITYDKLKKMQDEDIVLVDLRRGNAVANVRISSNTNQPVDLSMEFPKIRVVSSPFQKEARPVSAKVTGGASPLLILIDDGDGTAQKMAQTLRANGNRRFAILAGGEKILERHGQSGSDRVGTSISFRRSSNNAVSATNAITQ